jgi:hypothetical protein
VTYALDENRRTLLRASYSSFASQLNVTDPGLASAATYAYAFYLAEDANRDRMISASELIGNLGAVGVDLANPTNTSSPNRVQDDLNAPRTHEILLGVDRELMPNLAVTGAFTWRRFNDTLWGSLIRPLVGVTRADYVQETSVTGSNDVIGAFNVPVFALDPAAYPEGGGLLLGTREGYHRRYLGFEVSAVKRLSNRWMGRVGFSTNSEREYFDDPNTAIVDPTPTGLNPLVDGGVVTRRTGGSGKSQIFMISPKYQFIANGFVEGPWGINGGASVLVRQGFGAAYYANDVETSDPAAPTKDVLVVGDIDDFRLPAVTTVDVRVEKAFRVNDTNLMLDLDVFNLFNANTVLGRQYNILASNFNAVTEIMNPRIVRLGVRFAF